MPKRGCGSRKAGAAYLCTNVGPNGIPIEWLLFDPILKNKPPHLSSQGLVSFEHNGVWHLMDWIGERYYPYPADYIEEGRRMGFSGRIEDNFDFSLITPGVSTIWCWHPKAALLNPGEFYANRAQQYCPNADAEVRVRHLSFGPDENDITCAGLLWEVLPLEPGDVIEGRMIMRRSMPAGAYIAFTPPPGVEPQFIGGFFFRRPIHKVEIVVDRINGKHEEMEKKVREKNPSLTVEVCDE